MNAALRCTTSVASGNGLGSTIKYLQRTKSGAAGNGRAQRSSTCDAQRAAPRAKALAQQSSTCIGLGNTIKYLRGAAGIGLVDVRV
jgi:hypothetical protein